MAITETYSADPALVAQVAAQSGAAQHEVEQAARQQAISQFNQEQALRTAQFGEGQHQFDVEAAQRQYASDQQAHNQDQQAAIQQAHLEATLANDQAQRQAEMQRAQLTYDAATQDTQANVAARLQGQQQQYAQSAPQALEQQINAELAGARKMKFDPEGQRVFNQLQGEQSQIRAMKGQLRPDEYSAMQEKWSQKWSDSGLDGHEVKPPTIQDLLAQNVTKTADGAVWVMNEKRGLQYHAPVPPPKPTTIDLKSQEQERLRGLTFTQLPPDLTAKYINDAHNQLLKENPPSPEQKSETTGKVISPEVPPPNAAAIRKRAQANWDLARGQPLPPRVINSPEEAATADVGELLTYKGRTVRKVGQGQYQEVGQ